MRKSVFSAALAALASACSDPASVLPDDAEIRLLNPIAWPGQGAQLQAGVFAESDETPVVALDGNPVAVTRSDDSTFAVQLPDSSGGFQLTLSYRGGRRSGTVRVAGYVSHSAAPALSGWALPITPGAPVVVASSNGAVIRLDLRTGQAVTLPIAVNEQCILSPGPSYRSGVAITSRGSSCTGSLAWQVDPGAGLLDSGPGGGNYLRAETAPGVWFDAGAHHVRFAPAPAGQPALGYQLEEVERLVLSPSGALAAPLLQLSVGADVPVFTATGSIAFRIPVRQMQGAAFWAGDTLFAAGTVNYSVQHFLAVLPDGRIARRDSFNIPQILDLVLDPASSLLFALAYTEDGSRWAPIIHVVDRATMGRVAVLRPPRSADCQGFCNQVTLGVDRAANRLYALGIRGFLSTPSEPSTIWRFDLVPAQQQPVVLGN